MIERGMVRRYLHYVIPASIAFTLACVYSIIDGIFVGNCVGDAGLAGINVAWPLYAFVIAVGTGLGMGGAVISSVRAGAQNMRGARKAVGHTLLMLAVVGLPLMLVLLAFPYELCSLIGGHGETLEQAVGYLSVLAWAAPLQVLYAGSLPLIRNRGHVRYAMVVSLVAGMVKIACDYLFICCLGFGTTGAGAATACAQVISFFAVAGFFIRPGERLHLSDLAPNTELFVHTIKLGAAPFGLTLMPEVTVMVINVSAMTYGGETAVAAYAVIAYVAYAIQALIQGIGDGSQPLISQFKGAGNTQAASKIRNANFALAIVVAVGSLGAVLVLRDQIPLWFGASSTVAEMAAFAMPIIACAYLLFGFTHVCMAFFYATDNAPSSSTLVYGEAALVALFAVLLGGVFGLMGVWCAIVSAQVLLSFMAAALLHCAAVRQGSVKPLFARRTKGFRRTIRRNRRLA